jgi:hypothetical protein
MYGLAVIPQNAAAGQIYAPMRRFVPITSANFADCNSLSISTPIRYAFHPFPPNLLCHPPNLMLHKTGAPFMRFHRMSGHRAQHDRPLTAIARPRRVIHQPA